MFTKDEVISSLTTPRQAQLNPARWDQFLSMGLPIKDKVVFEPGAGIGDQTDWLLKQGVKQVIVHDGRAESLKVIKDRFAGDPRLSYVCGNLENCLIEPREPQFNFTVDFIYCYGIYYHLNESPTNWNIMRGLAKFGPTMAFDYLESHTGEDYCYSYGYEVPSTSMSRYAFRPTRPTLIKAVKDIWGYAYLPKDQLQWNDPYDGTERRFVMVASHVPLPDANLELQTA